MKSCGVSLTAAASAAARSLGVAGNDEEKMASGTATEIEEDFPKLTAQEKRSLLGADRLDPDVAAIFRPAYYLFFLIFFFCTTHFSTSAPVASESDRLPKVFVNPPVFSVLYLQFTVWISEASRRWRHNEGLAVKGMSLSALAERLCRCWFICHLE